MIQTKKENFLTDIDNLSKILIKDSEKIYKSFLYDVDITNIARDIDTKYRKENIFLAPLSIELNNIVASYSPIGGYKLTKQDLVSFTLSGQINDVIGKCAYTRSIMNFDNHKNLIYATNEACAAAIKESGVDVLLSELRFSINEILDSYGVSSLLNICGYDLYNTFRIIPNTRKIDKSFLAEKTKFKVFEEKMKEDDVFYIDVYASDTAFDVPAKKYKYSTTFLRTPKKEYIPILGPRRMLGYINNNYKEKLFSFRELTEDYPKYIFDKFPKERANRVTPKKFNKLAFNKLIEKELIIPFNTLEITPENEGQKLHNNVAHTGHTIHVKESGVKVVC